MVDNLSTPTLEMCAIILRQIWARKNRFIFEEKFDSPHNILLKAQILLENYQTTQQPFSDLTP